MAHDEPMAETDSPRGRIAGHDSLERLAGWAITFALAIIFLWFGLLKFTDYEASGVAGFIMNSPLIAWLHGVFGITGGARFLGIFEILSGLLIAGRLISSRLSVIGGAMGVVTFLVTLSLMLTTPGVIQPGHNGLPFLSAVPGQFLLKDLGLLAASFWVLATSLARTRSRPIVI
ncbi:MAG: YkgB family protein [Sphingomicrobium sp.]|nr:YkgB family protein [Sphingomonadales bacterium]